MTTSDATTRAEAPATEGVDAVRIGWWMFTSSGTLVILLSALASLLLAGAALPQGEGGQALLDRYDFSMATALTELGLDHVTTSWPAAFLTLLLLLSALGLLVRWRWTADAADRATHLWSGPGVARATTTLDGVPAEVAARAAPNLQTWVRQQTHDGEAVIMRRGLLGEGLLIVAIALVSVAAAALAGSLLATDARVELVPGAAPLPAAQQRVMVREGDRWLSRQIGVGLSCGVADPADPWRRRTCVLQRRGEEAELELAAGRTSRALGLDLTPLAEAPRAGGAVSTLLLHRPGASTLELLEAQRDRTYALPEGSRISAFPGADGPVIVVRPEADAKTPAARLLVPSTSVRDGAAAGERLQVDGVPGWLLTVAVRSRPHLPLTLAGVALLVLGLALIALVPQVVVVFLPSGDGTRVIAWSVNRFAWPAAVIASLRRAPPDDRS